MTFAQSHVFMGLRPLKKEKDMMRISLPMLFGAVFATPLFAQDICSDAEAYRFGHEGREIPAVCEGNARYMQEYERGSRDGRGALLGAVAAGAILNEAINSDDDFFYHNHHHSHGGVDHTHRHRHHNSHGGEAHGTHGGHHDHLVGHSGGHHPGGHHHH